MIIYKGFQECIGSNSIMSQMIADTWKRSTANFFLSRDSNNIKQGMDCCLSIVPVIALGTVVNNKLNNFQQSPGLKLLHQILRRPFLLFKIQVCQENHRSHPDAPLNCFYQC